MLKALLSRFGAVLVLAVLSAGLAGNPAALAQSPGIGAYPSAPPPPGVGAYPPPPGPPRKIGPPPSSGLPPALVPDAMDYCNKNPGACASGPPDANTVLQNQSEKRQQEQRKGIEIQEMQQYREKSGK